MCVLVSIIGKTSVELLFVNALSHVPYFFPLIFDSLKVVM